MLAFKLDENLPAEAAQMLRDAGHDVATVLEQRLGGAGDPRVADVCRTEGRVLLTFDTDFADIRTYPPREYAGIIVLRLVRQDKPHLLSVLQQLLPELHSEAVIGRLWIVEEASLRIRE